MTAARRITLGWAWTWSPSTMRPWPFARPRTGARAGGSGSKWGRLALIGPTAWSSARGRDEISRW